MARSLIESVALVVTIVAVSPCVLAQDAASVPVSRKLKSQASFDVYYATSKSLKIERMQKLAEIDRQFSWRS